MDYEAIGKAIGYLIILAALWYFGRMIKKKRNENVKRMDKTTKR